MRVPRANIRVLAAGCLLVFAACSGDSGPLAGAVLPGEDRVESRPGAVAPAPPSRTASPVGTAIGNATGRCDVKVTGDLSLTAGGVGDGGTVLSRHWTAKDEQKAVSITQALQFVCEAGSADAGVHVVFSSHADASNDDVPYGPKRYSVAGGTATARQFTVLLLVNDVPYVVQESGSLTITHWDSKAIAGSFQIRAREMLGVSDAPAVITVEGTFVYPCTGSAACRA